MDLISTITDKFLDSCTSYLSGLNWSYMITLMLLINVINAFFPDHIYSIGKFKFSFPTKYRVPTLAIIMALISYKINGYTDRQHVVRYFQSMLAAMILYLWFLDALVKTLIEKVPLLGEVLDKMKVVKNTEEKK